MSNTKSTYNLYRWLLVALLFFAAIINYLDRSTLSIANHAIAETFHIDPLMMGLLLSAFMWPYALASLPAGWLVDRVNLSVLFIVSILLWSVSSLLGGLAIGFVSLYAARVLLGIAEAPFFIIAGKIAQQYFDQNRGLAASIINTGPRIANGIAPPLLVFLMVYFGWRGMFIALGLIGLLIIIMWIIIQRFKPITAPTQTLEDHAQRTRISPWKLFKHPSVICLNIGNIGSSYIFWLYMTWLPYYLVENRGLSMVEMGFVMAIPFTIAIFSVLCGGLLSDYFIKKGMNRIKARLVPILFGCIVAGIIVFPINYIDNLFVVMACISISLFCLELRTGVLWAMVGDLSPSESVGTLGGIQNFANFLGGSLAPIITGYILWLTNSFNWVFIISGCFCLVGVCGYALIRKPILRTEISA